MSFNTTAPKRTKGIMNITFSARIKDGLIKRDAVYKPVMSAPNAFRMYDAIFFTPHVLISDKHLNEAIGSKLTIQDKKMVFLNNAQYNSYMKFILGLNLPKKDIKELEKPNGVIEKNIRFIADLFFGHKAPFYLGDKEYTIESYEWDRTFDFVESDSNVKLNLRFLLSEGKETSFMKSVEVSCAQKWQAIRDNYAFLTTFKEPTDPGAIPDAKKAWKAEHAAKEKDAPYAKQPTAPTAAALRANRNQYNPSSPPMAQAYKVQAQAYNVQAKSNIAVAKIQAESVRKTEESESKSRADLEDVRIKADVDAAEKQRLADEATAEKKRLADIETAANKRAHELVLAKNNATAKKSAATKKLNKAINNEYEEINKNKEIQKRKKSAAARNSRKLVSNIRKANESGAKESGANESGANESGAKASEGGSRRYTRKRRI